MCKQKRQLQEGARESRVIGQCGIVAPSCTGLTSMLGMQVMWYPPLTLCLVITRAVGHPMQFRLEAVSASAEAGLASSHDPLSAYQDEVQKYNAGRIYYTQRYSREFSEGDSSPTNRQSIL